MIRKFGLPLCAILGISFALYMLQRGAQLPDVPEVAFPPASSPYAHAVAGTGLVESAYEDVAVSVPFPELVVDVYVSPGDMCRAGDALFLLDTRALRAQRRELVRRYERARVVYENAVVRLSYFDRLATPASVSERSHSDAWYEKEEAREHLEEVRAAIDRIDTDIARSCARAPTDGEVLQVNVRAGEFANVNPFDKQPLILFGDAEHHHVRVDVNEEDMWRLEKGAPAMAYVRGNRDIAIPLTYVYTEPYVVPKRSLSGANTEQVDTRVLQVIYRCPKRTYPIYDGQLLDVFIQANESHARGDSGEG